MFRQSLSNTIRSCCSRTCAFDERGIESVEYAILIATVALPVLGAANNAWVVDTKGHSACAELFEDAIGAMVVPNRSVYRNYLKAREVVSVTRFRSARESLRSHAVKAILSQDVNQIPRCTVANPKDDALLEVLGVDPQRGEESERPETRTRERREGLVGH